MKIILTGANGQVGKEIQKLQPAEVELIALDRNNLNIADARAVDHMIKHHQPTVVINAAAYTAVDRAENDCDNAKAVNALGPLHLARACDAQHAALIHISTDYVFNGEKNSPYLESDPVNPLGVYGETKWQGEVAVRDHLAKHIILRTSWVFGAHGNNFVKTILRLAKERDELKIVNDQIGCPTSAKSIAMAIWKIISHLKTNQTIAWGTYHYTDVDAVSWYEFAKEIIKINQSLVRVKSLLPITTAEYPTPAKRPAYSVLSTQKITDTLQIQPQSWRMLLQEMCDELNTV